jgi:hypothetical protein
MDKDLEQEETEVTERLRNRIMTGQNYLGETGREAKRNLNRSKRRK